MALSLGNRRRGQTSTAWASQRQQSSFVSHSHAHLLNNNQQQQQLLIRKQNSFIESGSTGSSSGRGNLSRGLSVGRSFDNIRQRLIVPVVGRPQKHSSVRLQKNLSIEQESKLRTNSKLKPDQPLKATNNLNTNFNSRYCGSNVNKSGSGIGIGVKSRQRSVVAWSSTSSLLKSLDDELDELSSGIIERKKNSNNPNQSSDIYLKQEHNKNKDSSSNDQFITHGKHQKPISIVLPGDPSKINLNIVLSQTIKATTENETAHSDIDSSSEGADIVSSSITSRLESENKSTAFGAVRSTSALHRRAQFHSSRSTTINVAASPVTTNTSAVAPNNSNFSASPSLTVQRRPPLVRAMSAPVRTVIDENSKSIIAGSKRKSRRRKLTRSDKTEAICSDNKSKDPNLDDDINGGGKKILSRARSVAVPDVITLVSLVSSEGSDSEKEDSSATTTTTNSDNSPTRRAPFLRKTGKSVSFQENYPPNFQLAAKEYSHMIRRGSIAPLAARIRANRPPTAPPVSIFLNDPNASVDAMTTSPTKDNASRPAATAESDKITPPKQEQEYVFPDYVRSIKERECWKLYQKMSTKGVNVTYDTILRGMLTPTEFRHLQKQREIEEAKARENEEATIELDAAVKPQPTAIERLSETLLKK